MWYKLHDIIIDPKTGGLAARPEAKGLLDDENPTGFEPSSRPGFIPQVRWSVIERAKDDKGHVRCACCTNVIREDQVITIHHKVPWSELKRALEQDAEYRMLDEGLRERWRRDVFNDVQGHGENLVPMHVSCHFEHDTGKKIEDDERRALMDAGLPVKLAKIREPKPMPARILNPDEQRQLYVRAVMRQLSSRYMMPDGVVFPASEDAQAHNVALIKRMQKSMYREASEKRSPAFSDLWQLRLALEHAHADWKIWQSNARRTERDDGEGMSHADAVQQRRIKDAARAQAAL